MAVRRGVRFAIGVLVAVLFFGGIAAAGFRFKVEAEVEFFTEATFARVGVDFQTGRSVMLSP